ncbi:hypothetical protein AVEN_174722-1 [Araneus ventricosus]|uniref:HAT C-terminal dimerisation domain-containing protein n=1 Tax=Araneus ventricosus TaxID=182803 RepID=A0A4Y2BLE1_ARAVE|nr:hypothetical protein AVEN_174722-1 [Araneus ventricosus]
MRAHFEVLIFRGTSVRCCLISQNGQVVENWISASRTEIRTTDLAAMEITMDHQDSHEVQRPIDWPVQNLNLKKRNLIDFWVAVKEEYQELGVKAIKYLIPFTNTEHVERAFSSYTYIKDKYRNKLDAARNIRLYLFSFEPNFKKLSSMKQAQGSH